jgi:hypothetical protein
MGLVTVTPVTLASTYMTYRPSERNCYDLTPDDVRMPQPRPRGCSLPPLTSATISLGALIRPPVNSRPAEGVPVPVWPLQATAPQGWSASLWCGEPAFAAEKAESLYSASHTSRPALRCMRTAAPSTRHNTPQRAPLPSQH